MFRFWGSQDQQSQQQGSSQSWYPPSVMSSSSSSRPATPASSSGSPRPSSHVPPAEAAGTIASLKDKSVDELRKLLSDKDAYQQFLQSLEQVKIQSNLKDELSKENLQLAEENLQKEPRIMELRNQCRIIRTTELATASEKLNELEKQKEEMLKLNSPASLIQRIQESVNQTDEESENLHQQLLDKEIDLAAFLQKYKKLRTTYHKRTLVHLAAKTSNI
ncbi:vacuolar protein-sorting-associated protein 37 homolog 1-like [Vicia villosa]|uniref:vacuolar protein-sorting-associated protein 37 homolog 1-like n=1 Tax=Vicia villosa TaxID=3911 RepID=UPI00273CD91D|nr:vacuolar protein-sorting-associated protein 37 homolog 1-like [Vicia villosa]